MGRVSRRMNALDADPRWRRLMSGESVCPCCGERHRGPFDLAWGKPDFWTGTEEKAPNSAIVGATDILTEDFCVIDGKYFFVRAVIELPIADSAERFAYGVWTSLSEKNFNAFLETFDSGDQGGLGPWFGYLCNALKGYPDTLRLELDVRPSDGRQRPKLYLRDESHPLAAEQRDGVSLDRLLEIYALNGHDMRPLLTDG